jgi:glucarate dehydratase
MLEAAQELAGQYGFTTWKYKCGVKPPMEEVATAGLLRKEFPDDKIRMDPNGSWGISTSVQVLHAVRDICLEFLEDPVPAFPKLARVHAMNLGTPLASNQAVASLETIALNEALNAVDIPLLDVNWYGGIRACMTAGRMAELIGLDVGVHSSMECAISQAAQLHLAACLANLVYASDTHYIYLKDDIGEGGKLPIRDGKMTVPPGPGLGIKIDQDKLNHYHRLWEESGFFNWGSDAGFPVTLPRW